MDLLKLAKQKKVLVVAHRGTAGGNIPCNSAPAFKAALNMGADIIETDIEISADGKLFILHPGMEKVHLRQLDRIKSQPASFVEQLKLSNWDLCATQYPILYLEQALEMLKGKCLINLDKFWMNPKEISALIRRLGMEDQIIIKTSDKPEYIDDVERYAPDIPFMTIAKNVDTTHESLKKRSINYVGTEVLFEKEDAPVASKEYIDMMHADGKIVWANSIVYNYKAVLSAGHNDDVSMADDPALGWGWLADRGFDLIQTDFVHQCVTYLVNTGRKNK